MEIQSVAKNLWIVDGEAVRWFTFPFSTRMTIIRLDSGELFIHSPIHLTSELQTQIEEIGNVRHIVSPNKIHHLFMGEWAAAFPNAVLYASPGLSKKRRDLSFGMELVEDASFPWSSEIDHSLFRGSSFMIEVVFFHRLTKTLILGDLIENFDPEALSMFHRLLARFGGILAPHGGTPRDFRATFRDKESAKCSVKDILAWSPERVVFAHGLWVERNAVSFLRDAFSWALSEA